jgi:UDP-N-acetylglucosamine--N-acetylmuramyl-(pentapeptide) pyrophosphoryl-undecaprenol N-acetylglucosamine transferase
MSRGPIMIVAGGTGGHVFPGIAVAQALRARDFAVVWLGTQRGIEARVVPANGIEIEWITIAGVRGRGLGAYLSAPFRVVAAVAQALAALRRRNPTAVLGMGGFVAAPGGIATAHAQACVHEQNSVAGTTNRLLAPLAAAIFAAFPDTFPASARVEVVGNPVRDSIVPGGDSRSALELLAGAAARAAGCSSSAAAKARAR